MISKIMSIIESILFYFCLLTMLAILFENKGILPFSLKLTLYLALTPFLMLLARRRWNQSELEEFNANQSIEHKPSGDYVLYLRSFKTEQHQQDNYLPSFPAYWLGKSYFTRPIEYGLKIALKSKVLALQNPHSVIATGVQRIRLLDDKEWQNKVSELLQGSKLVVIFFSEISDAISFELNLILSNPKIPTLLIIDRTNREINQRTKDDSQFKDLLSRLNHRGNLKMTLLKNSVHFGSDQIQALQCVTPDLTRDYNTYKSILRIQRIKNPFVFTCVLASFVLTCFASIMSLNASLTHLPDYVLPLIFFVSQGASGFILTSMSFFFYVDSEPNVIWGRHNEICFKSGIGLISSAILISLLYGDLRAEITLVFSMASILFLKKINTPPKQLLFTYLTLSPVIFYLISAFWIK